MSEELVQSHVAAASISEQLQMDTTRVTSKPQRLQQDVWEVLQEYVRTGGLLDLGEEIAASVRLEKETMDATMDMRDKLKIRAAIIRDRAAIKSNHQKMQIASRNFINIDAFVGFMEELFVILQRRIIDPVQLRQIGNDMASLAKTLQSKVD